MKMLVIMSVCFVGLVGSRAAQETLTGYFEMLRSEKIEDRDIAVKEILEDRNQTIAEVEKIAKEFISSDERKGTAKSAIDLLGNLRSIDSVTFLADNLTFNIFFKDYKGTANTYPCADALIGIGMPSLEPVLKRAQDTDDEKVIYLSAYVVKYILGETLAPVYMEEQIKNVQDEKKQARLVRVREQMKDIKIW